MQLDEKSVEILKCVIEQMIPPADYPGVFEERVLPHVRKHVEEMEPEGAEAFVQALGQVNNESYAIFGGPFTELHPSTRDELLDRLESDNVRLPWEMPPAEFVQLLVDLTAEALGMKPT